MNSQIETEDKLAATAAKSSFPETDKTLPAVLRFVDWLNQYGETSYDFQDYYASDLGRYAKALYYRKPRLGTLAVAPMVFSEAFMPSAKAIF